MEPAVVEAQFRSAPKDGEEMGFVLDEIQGLISVPPETESSSFTALLELPPPKAVELLVKEDFTDEHPICPSDFAVASMFSVFPAASTENSLESTVIFSRMVKQEPLDPHPHSCSDKTVNPSKRKHKEKQVKESNKKIKKAGGANDEKLPYVHVRARRGQATDSHSLAERARREKINARMKLLQELVPGCNKISGTALVLDEIINHVQALQRQVEFLSMRIAAVDPRIDFPPFDCLLPPESGNSNHPSLVWPENEMNLSSHQHHHHHHHQFLQQPLQHFEDEDSLLSSASLHSSQLRMEL